MLKVHFLLTLLSLPFLSFCWFDGWTFNIFAPAPAAPDVSSSHRIASCDGHNKFVVRNGSDTHRLSGSSYTVEHSFGRQAYCVRVSEDCQITALKANQTISVYHDKTLQCQISHSWIQNSFALSRDGALIANPQCSSSSTFEVAFYNNKCATAYPSLSLAVPCASVIKTMFRRFFNQTKLLAYLVKTDDVPAYNNRKSYVFVMGLKGSEFEWEEVLTFNGEAIQAEISEGGETMVVQTTNQTYIYKADAAGKLQLTEKMPYNGSEITISKDGSKIFFSVGKKAHYHRFDKHKKKFTKVHQVQASDTIVGLRFSLHANVVFAALPTSATIFQACNSGQWSDGTQCFDCSATNCEMCSSESVCASCNDGFELLDGRCRQIINEVDNRTWILGIIFVVFLACSLIILTLNTKMQIGMEGNRLP